MQPSQDNTASTDRPGSPLDDAAEMYAASPAEGHAITHSSKSSLPETIVTIERRKHSPEPTSPRNEPAHADASAIPTEVAEATAPEPDAGTGTDAGAGAQMGTEAPALEEKTQTKEEMIEEALNCPCIASMKEGSCGDVFVTAYKCFLTSDTEPKGMDCMDGFKSMQQCLAEHPDEYNLNDDDDEENADGLADMANPFPSPADPEPSAAPPLQKDASPSPHMNPTPPTAQAAS